MIEFDENKKNAQLLGVHYAKKVDDKFVIDFISSKADISTPEQAISLTEVFWKMVDLSIKDNENDISIAGISDIEFWMYQLFNNVYGYIVKKGFEKQWNETTKRTNAE